MFTDNIEEKFKIDVYMLTFGGVLEIEIITPNKNSQSNIYITTCNKEIIQFVKLIRDNRIGTKSETTIFDSNYIKDPMMITEEEKLLISTTNDSISELELILIDISSVFFRLYYNDASDGYAERIIGNLLEKIMNGESITKDIQNGYKQKV